MTSINLTDLSFQIIKWVFDSLPESVNGHKIKKIFSLFVQTVLNERYAPKSLVDRVNKLFETSEELRKKILDDDIKSEDRKQFLEEMKQQLREGMQSSNDDGNRHSLILDELEERILGARDTYKERKVFLKDMESLIKLPTKLNAKTIDCFLKKTNNSNLKISGLQEIPKDITRRLSHLEVLSVTITDFQYLSFIKDLPKLHTLSLYPSGQLSEINVFPSVVYELIYLKTLVVSNFRCVKNILESISSMVSLENLNICNDGENSRFPDAIGKIPNLKKLTLKGIEIDNHAVDQLMKLPARCKIIPKFPLTFPVIEYINDSLENAKIRGESFPVFVDYNRYNKDRKSFVDSIKNLCQVAERSSSIPLKILLEESMKVGSDFKNWASRIDEGLVGKNKKIIANMVLTALEYAENNASFRSEFFALIRKGADLCGDRIILTVMQVMITYKTAKASEDYNPRELAYLLIHGSWVLQELERIARKKIDDLKEKRKKIDQAEVRLALPILLQESLNLPIENNEMNYLADGHITPEDLRIAEKYLRLTLVNKYKYCEALVEDKTWGENLEKHNKEYCTARQKQQEEIDNFNTNSIQLSLENMEKDKEDRKKMEKIYGFQALSDVTHLNSAELKMWWAQRQAETKEVRKFHSKRLVELSLTLIEKPTNSNTALPWERCPKPPAGQSHQDFC